MKKISFFVLILCTLLNFSGMAQAPVINPISGPANVCWNGPVPVSFTTSASNSPSNYVWTVVPANNVVATVNSIPGGSAFILNFPNGNDSYTLFCTANNASGSSATMSFVVNIFQKPNVTFSGNTIFCRGSSTSISASPTQASPTQGSSTQGSSTLLYTWSPGTGLNTTTGPNVIANPTLTTTYTVTVLNGPCTSTAPITIFVMPNPVISVNSGAICQGQSFTITPSGGVNYVYPGGSPVVSPSSSAFYIVTGTDANGCTDTAGCQVNVLPVPPLNVTSSNDTICQGEFVLLTATGASSYQWSSGSAADTAWVNPPMDTYYTVTGTGSNGCSATFVMYQVVDVCTGIKDHSGALSGSSVYPNPSPGILTVDPGETGNEPVSLEIIDALGQVVVADTIRTTTVLNLEHLADGIYMVVLKQNTSVKTLKLIRE